MEYFNPCPDFYRARCSCRIAAFRFFEDFCRPIGRKGRRGQSRASRFKLRRVHEGARTNRCVPGGDDTAKKISEILGTDAEDVTETVAFVACGGCLPEITSDAFSYEGEPSCAACNMYYKGRGVCDYACLGFGDCVKQCSFDAIHVENRIAVVTPEKCTGCTMCTKACPKNLIHIRDLVKTAAVTCSSHDLGRVVMQKCKHGCIGCRKCEKTCPTGAITVEQNLAAIDYNKCINCHACVEVCPRGCINLLGESQD